MIVISNGHSAVNHIFFWIRWKPRMFVGRSFTAVLDTRKIYLFAVEIMFQASKNRTTGPGTRCCPIYIVADINRLFVYSIRFDDEHTNFVIYCGFLVGHLKMAGGTTHKHNYCWDNELFRLTIINSIHAIQLWCAQTHTHTQFLLLSLSLFVCLVLLFFMCAPCVNHPSSGL